MIGRGRNVFDISFVLLCAAYLLAIPWTPSLPGVLLKILPIQMLVARAASRAARSQHVYLTLGLLFSLTGDVILALSPDALFVQGVAAFLIAHVLYILTFRRDMRYSTRSAILAALVLAWCAAAGSVVFPHLGPLRAPVVGYMIVIATMGVSAAFATGKTMTLFAGAFGFIISDSILAIDRFVAPFAYAPHLVMTTYYFGQFFIVAGVLRHTAPHVHTAVTE